jgi:DnaK suppressor protein
MNVKLKTLDIAQVLHFKTILDADREKELDSLRRLEAEQRGLDCERPIEFGDSCIESAGREDLYERISHQRRIVERIEAALRRITYGTFGKCSACGDAISHRRLEIMPWTEYCVPCQEELERAGVSRSTWAAFHRVQRLSRSQALDR